MVREDVGPRAIVITIGNELLNGTVVDTNSADIARRLLSIGISVDRMVSIGDDPMGIDQVLRDLFGRWDIALVTGGLGPTEDDITTEAAAAALGRRLVLDSASLDHIHTMFQRYGLEMTPNNEKQALLPEGARVVPNPMGTAPGFVVEERGTTLVFLPGVPRELARMLDETVIPLLLDRRQDRKVYRTRTLRIFGLSEAKMGQMIQGIDSGISGIRLASLPSYPENRIEITAFGEDPERVEGILAEVEGRIRERLDPWIYGGEGDSLESVTGGLLRSRRMTLSVAESCTGGFISHRLTNVPGSSDYFKGSIVAYSNEAKMDLLGVSEGLIRQFGPVSTQVAEAMASGVRRARGTALGLGVTGVAGPDGGTTECPVGTVCIALSEGNQTRSKTFRFWGGREGVKTLASSVAIDWIRRHLLGWPTEWFSRD